MPSTLPKALIPYLRWLQTHGSDSVLLSREARTILRRWKQSTAEAPPARSATQAPAAPRSNVPSPSNSDPLPPRTERPAPKASSSSTSSSQPPTFLPRTESPGVETTAPIEIGSGTAQERLDRLRAVTVNCQKCPHLARSRQQVVFGVGNPEAQLLFVGEAPGADEDEAGEPFVGRAGELLTRMIKAMGLSRETVYIANIVKCRPDLPPGVPGNRKPTLSEMNTCRPYVLTQIEIIRPRVIVALGATAVEGLLGLKQPMGSIRGKFFDFQGVPVLPTYHPAYILRNQANSEKRKVWEDLLRVMEQLELPISEKQRQYFL